MASGRIVLACSVCGSRNYTIKSNAIHQERLEVNKFCKNCKKYTLHRETK